MRNIRLLFIIAIFLFVINSNCVVAISTDDDFLLRQMKNILGLHKLLSPPVLLGIDDKYKSAHQEFSDLSIRDQFMIDVLKLSDKEKVRKLLDAYLDFRFRDEVIYSDIFSESKGIADYIGDRKSFIDDRENIKINTFKGIHGYENLLYCAEYAEYFWSVHDDERNNLKKYVSQGDIPKARDVYDGLNEKIESSNNKGGASLEHHSQDNPEHKGKKKTGIKKTFLSLFSNLKGHKYKPLGEDESEHAETYKANKNVSSSYKRFGK